MRGPLKQSKGAKGKSFSPKGLKVDQVKCLEQKKEKCLLFVKLKHQEEGRKINLGRINLIRLSS